MFQYRVFRENNARIERERFLIKMYVITLTVGVLDRYIGVENRLKNSRTDKNNRFPP